MSKRPTVQDLHDRYIQGYRDGIQAGREAVQAELRDLLGVPTPLDIQVEVNEAVACHEREHHR